MRPLRILVGLITLAYAIYVMLEGALGVVGMAGPLPIKLVATLGAAMHLAAGQPWWRAGLEVVAGLLYAFAGSRLMASRNSAWGAFLLAALTDIAARWIISLIFAPALVVLEGLVMADKVLLIILGIGFLVYLGLGRLPAKRTPPVLLMEMG